MYDEGSDWGDYARYIYLDYGFAWSARHFLNVTLEGKSLEADLYYVIHLARATGSHLLEVDASELQHSGNSIAGKSETENPKR
jgi:hypothetical protein